MSLHVWSQDQTGSTSAFALILLLCAIWSIVRVLQEAHSSGSIKHNVQRHMPLFCGPALRAW